MAWAGDSATGRLLDDNAEAATRNDIEMYFAGLKASTGGPLRQGIGRRRAAVLLSLLGHPQNVSRTVHVAGTAGKGSVSTFLSAILCAHGWHVGTYLSPHAYSVFERFCVDGQPATPAELGPAVQAVRRKEIRVRRGPLGPVTMFEAATATAFRLFSGQNVDYAVVETGLGGLHDATNTVTRQDKIAVLTTIGLDHTDVLGPTIAHIAAEKAGILPEGGSAVAVRGGPEVDDVVAEHAARRGCHLDQLAVASLERRVEDLPTLGLAGEHQRVNAGLAVHVAGLLAERDGWLLAADRVARGLAAAWLPGRFERRSRGGHPVILDGAHNGLKLAALADTVGRHWSDPAPVWVLTLKSDKDLAAVSAVAGRASLVVATEYDTAGVNVARGIPARAGEVASAMTRAGAPAMCASGLPAAIDAAIARSPAGVPIIVAGSFFAVADAAVLMDP